MGKRTLAPDMEIAIRELDDAIGRVSAAINTDPKTAGDANLCGLNVQLIALLGRIEAHMNANYDWD